MNANVSIYQDSVKDSSGILTSESNEMGLSTIFNYNGNNVAFIKTSYGILINATDMARPYNKRPVDYLRQIYVNELVSTIVSQTHISEDQLVIKMRGSSENGGGTWLNPNHFSGGSMSTYIISEDSYQPILSIL